MTEMAAYAGILTEMTPFLREVEETIVANLSTRSQLVETINRYVIGSGGKRLRPLLMVLSARMCGYRGDDPVKLAAVIEFLHSATLLHDDVLDEAALRRGNPTASNRWGNAAAVLSGDFLFSRAFAMLVESYSREVTLMMLRAAGDMIEGEVMELANRHRDDLTEDEYRRVIGLKTASLIASSCASGAMLGGGDGRRAEALRRFGFSLGLAFQIIDDVLDFIGDPRRFGKEPGGDLREGTMTLPLLKLMGKLPPAENERLRRLIASSGATEDDVRRVIALVREHGADREANAEAGRLVAEARAILAEFDAGPYRRMLEAAADYVLSRRA